MVWSNYFLIPIVLVGGLLAYMFGQTVVGGLLRTVRGFIAPRAVAPNTARQEPAYKEPIYTPPQLPRSSPKRLLAERQAEWDARAIELADQREAEADRLRALDLEEARIAALKEEARKASKSSNVLIGKLQVDPKAGPLTTAIAMTDAVQEMLKAARDSNPPK